MVIQGIIFDYKNDPYDYRQRFIHACGTVNKIYRKTLGHKNSIPLEPYLKRVSSHSQNLMIPYPAILPVIMEHVAEGDISHTVLHPEMPIDLEEL